MKILNVVQGSAEWLAARASYRCASDAPVMMGASKHTTRAELLRMRATGNEKEFSEWAKKNLLIKGHEAEDAARAIIEAEIGEEFYPVTATDDDGYLLASYDGLVMAGDTGFEHKLWNESLAAAMTDGGTLPAMYYWQLEQQILIGKLKRIIFVCSDGTPERFLKIVYEPVPGRAEQLLAGWKQFDEDLANYQHVEVLPAPTAKVIRDLPAIVVDIAGKVKKSNLGDYRAHALAFIEQINTTLETDQDFADAENTIKFCDTAEKKLDAAKDQALSQTASVRELFTTLDELREAMRAKRLSLEKLVKARKESIRADIIEKGRTKLSEHCAMLNERIGRNYMPTVPADFAGAIKGKKTVQSLRDAVDTELARAKIEANAVADRISLNLRALADLAPDDGQLFPDLRHIVTKEADDFAALVKTRVAEQRDKEAEQKRREEAARAEATPPATPPAAPAVTAEPAAGASNVVGIAAQKRPTDAEIIRVLCAHYRVDEAKVLEWLRTMKLHAARPISA